MSEKPIIQLENVIKRYTSGESAVFALNGLNISINEGEFIVVMGPSGSGKTTLLNVISGMLKPTEGSIMIKDKKLDELSDNQKAELRRHTFGFIFQFYNLHDGLTAKENVELPMLIAQSLPLEKRRTRSKELLEMVGLLNRMNNHTFELSGGERQRVGIARALANDPPILLADEPTGDLDSEKATEILELLVQLNDKFQKTMLMVTHDVGLLRPGMRLLTMEDGVIKEDIVVKKDQIHELKEKNHNSFASA